MYGTRVHRSEQIVEAASSWLQSERAARTLLRFRTRRSKHLFFQCIHALKDPNVTRFKIIINSRRRRRRKRREEELLLPRRAAMATASTLRWRSTALMASGL